MENTNSNSFLESELNLIILTPEELTKTEGGGWAYDAGRRFMSWILDDLPYYEQSSGSKAMHSALG